MIDGRAIKIENFTKAYGDVVAVDSVSFDVGRGEIFGLLGPNGAGKTSTLECLEGIRTPTSGRMTVCGIDPAKEPRKLRAVMGVQLQSSGLPESIAPLEAMRLFCAYHRVPVRLDLLNRFGLAEKKNTQFQQLSTGQQRRLSLALAIAHDPEVLFLDEPTAGLDVGSRAELHEILRELKSAGTTILLATHDMAEAEALSDRIAILLDHRIAGIGTPLEITATGAGLTKVSVRTEAASLTGAEEGLPAVDNWVHKENYLILMSTDVGPTVSAIISYVEKHGDRLIDLRVERPSLEERFLEITTGGVAP